MTAHRTLTSLDHRDTLDVVRRDAAPLGDLTYNAASEIEFRDKDDHRYQAKNTVLAQLGGCPIRGAKVSIYEMDLSPAQIYTLSPHIPSAATTREFTPTPYINPATGDLFTRWIETAPSKP